MKKNLLFTTVFLLIAPCLQLTADLFAQTPGEWTWMHGDNTPNNALGVFGAQGVPDPANKPPCLYEPCEWTDKNGNFWLFGGSNINGEYAVLWKYDPDPASPTYNQWTWVKGTSTPEQPGVYGTQGIPSSVNYPGARAWGAATWVDASGNLWLFGGAGYAAAGYGRLNDLWKYDIISNQWTWMKGPNTINDPGSYGTQGVSIPSNLPPARDESTCSWVDNAGNLWLYGGDQWGGLSFGDLWKYDTSGNEWTWIHGSNTPNPPAVYGTQGLAAPSNTPGGRWVYCSWTDLTGNLWLFGGGSALLRNNDLWKYDPIANQWTWMKGSNTPNNNGNYGTKCVSTNNNMPRARMENRARVRDACGNFWNFGGAFLNDLWHYNVSTNQWTWVSGDIMLGQPGVYGTRGISNPANKPAGRMGGVAWLDNKGYLWVFGGMSGSNQYNDLFRYVPDTNCIPVCNTVFSIAIISTNILCNNQCTGTATANANNGTSPYTYSWTTLPVQTTQIATGLCANTYTVIVTDGAGSAATAMVIITQPAALTATTTSTSAVCGSTSSATVTAGGGTPGYTYKWNTIPAQTTQTATGLGVGNYTVAVTDANGCTQTQTVTITSNNTLSLTVSSTQAGCTTVNNGTASATPVNGTAPYSYNWNNGQTTSIATALAAGIYTLTVTDVNGCTQTQIVTVTTIPGPTVTVAASPVIITIGAGTTLSATGGGTYSWSPPSGLSCITCFNPIAFPSGTTMYCVTVTDSNGCSDSACVTVLVELDCSNSGELYLPNAFSPNSDGENDLLQVYYGNYHCIKTFKLVIYGRWGEKVFETTDAKASWNGTEKGTILNTSVYVYYLQAMLVTGEEIGRKGNVSLIR